MRPRSRLLSTRDDDELHPAPSRRCRTPPNPVTLGTTDDDADAAAQSTVGLLVLRDDHDGAIALNYICKFIIFKKESSQTTVKVFTRHG